MAGRPPKKGIDYSGWSVGIFDNDTKIDKLLDAHGWVGFGIYFYLCQRIYGGEGYFYRWCYDDCASTSRKMGGGIGAGTVRETVGYCLQIGLFDQGLFDGWGVLTSRGIQRRYWEVVKDRDVRSVISDYWLLQDEECKGLIKIPLNANFPERNANFPERNANFPERNADFPERNADFPPIKESKVKESKVKGRKNIGADQKPSRAVKPKAANIYFSDNENLNQAFCDFAEMRKRIRKPMTDRAVELAIKKLHELAEVPFSDELDIGHAIRILEQSTMNCWQGLFPLREDRSDTKKRTLDEHCSIVSEWVREEEGRL